MPIFFTKSQSKCKFSLVEMQCKKQNLAKAKQAAMSRMRMVILLAKNTMGDVFECVNNDGVYTYF
jgi:hypothetical protein